MDFTLSQRAVFAMLGAVLIYGTNFAISRHGIQSGLTSMDMTLLRFAVAGAILMPMFIKAGVGDCAGIGWRRGLVLTLMSGLPMTLLMMVGLSMAPAAHGASIAPGTVTVIGAVGGLLMFGVKPGRMVIFGIGVVLLGLVCIGIAGGTSGSWTVVWGDLCFLGVGLVWGGYPLLLQLWKVDALRAAAAMSVISMVLVLPLYAALGGGNLLHVPLTTVLIHAVNQGIFNMIIGLWLWGFAVKTLGAAQSGRFPPLIPVIGTLTAIPLLGEWPKPLQIAGVALIVTGLLLTAFRRPV
jgi:drug/metabolite transporter (DMT)-like permease